MKVWELPHLHTRTARAEGQAGPANQNPEEETPLAGTATLAQGSLWKQTEEQLQRVLPTGGVIAPSESSDSHQHLH